MFCKGDDVRISFAIPCKVLEGTTMSHLKNQIITEIATTLKSFGHKINIQESYGSSIYYAFSKYASLGRVELPQSFRKIQKVHGANNAFLPTLDDYIASTFSNAHSVCKTNASILGCYATAYFWATWYLVNYDIYSMLSDAAYTACLLVPSILGGFPIIYYHNMWVRAESDLLSPFLGLLMFARESFHESYPYMSNFCYAPVGEIKDRDLLFRDPYALPSLRPSLPTSGLRHPACSQKYNKK